MTLDAAVGSPDKAADNLMAMLAASETFQTWAGASTSTEAAEHVYLDGVEPADPTQPFTAKEIESLLPFVVVFEQDASHTEEAVLADSWAGTFVVEFTGEAGEGTPGEVNRRINNVVSGVVNDMLEMRGESGYLADFRATRVGSPWRDRDEAIPVKGELVHRVIHVRWAGL